MQIFIVLVLGHAALTLASESSIENPGNCTQVVDKVIIKKKVTSAVQKAVERLFNDASFFRRRRFVVDQHTRVENNTYQRSEIHDEQIPNSVALIESVGLKRQHQRVSKRYTNYQDVSSSEDNANANAFLKSDSGSSYQKATAKGSNSASASATKLRRSKRFCLPISYDDNVKRMVRKVVDEAFKTIQF